MHIQFIRQTEGFRDWLELLGYESSSVQNLPRVITRYLSYMETRKLKQISEISSIHTTDWYNKERQRKSRQTGQLLKNSTLNGINRTLRLFSRYLEETGQGILTIDIPYEEKASTIWNAMSLL